MTLGACLLFSFLFLILMGIPISMSMGISTLMTLLLTGDYNLQIIPLMTERGVDDFLLIAIPFFILAANIMNSGGITKRIFNFSDALVGHFKGGLAHVNVLSSMIFSGISGTAVGDQAGLGMIEIKAMTDKGYEKSFSAAITLASSVIGPIIPPSVGFIVYAMLAQVSVAKMFLAGLIPGVIVGITLMITNYVLIDRGIFDAPVSQTFSHEKVWKTFKEGFWALLAPTILLAGIMSGVVTPTEVGLLAVLYSTIVGLIYKELNLKRLMNVFEESLKTSAMVMFLIGIGKAIGFVVAAERFPILLSQSMLALTQNKFIILLLINILFFILGMFIQGVPVTLIMVPILLPVIDKIDVSRIQFGVMQSLNLLIGMSTPPVGLGLFVISSIADLEIQEIFKAILPYFIPLLLALLLITYVPFITTWLPSILG